MLTVDSYTEEMLTRRLIKETKLLDKLKRGISKIVKETNFGKIIYLDFKKKMFKGISADPVRVEIHVEGKFPFQAPKVILNTVTGFPSLADGRNLLQGIIKKPWSEDIPIYEIANSLPQFLSENHLNYSVGRFHLGQCMSLKMWDGKDGMKLFLCQEIDPQNPKFFRDRALVLTHSMILQLETNPSYPDLAHLVSYASLFSLLTVKVGRSDNKKITFEWRIPEGVNALAQQFRISQAEEFINLLIINSEKLGITFDRKNLRPAQSISEEDVSAQALTRVKIQEIMEGIVRYEVAIQDDINIDVINKLIDLYQRAIEYYSALNDPKFETYLLKVRKLNSDEIVLDVLAGKPPPKKVKDQENTAVKAFEELEIWPSGPPPEVSEFRLSQEVKKVEEDEEEELEERNAEISASVDDSLKKDAVQNEEKSEDRGKNEENKGKNEENEGKIGENEGKIEENEGKIGENEGKIEKKEEIKGTEELQKNNELGLESKDNEENKDKESN